MWYFYNYFCDSNFDELMCEIDKIYLNVFRGKNFKDIIDENFAKLIERNHKIKILFYDFYKIYNVLERKEKEKVFLAFKRNVQIENICLGKIKPICYDELDKDIASILREICDYWYKDFTKTNLFKNRVGGLKKYYENFRSNTDLKLNKRCPFCGLGNMPSSKDKSRSDFDHYLLESKYPFVSLLRRNLIPMCKQCNQVYKEVKDISDYKKVFYPFDCNVNNILEYVDHKFIINSNGYDQEVNTWNDIFNVELNINIHAEELKIGWIESINNTKLWSEQLDFADALDIKISDMDYNYFSSDNFIEKAYLEELKKYI